MGSHPNAEAGTTLPEPGSAWVEKLRAYSEVAAQDADLVTLASVSGLEEDICLGGQLYVERTVERKEIRSHLLAEEPQALLIVGHAGYGKTSLLWSLYRWLLRARPGCEVWLLKAALLGGGDDRPEGYPTASQLCQAIGTCVEQGRPPILLVDTADVQLHEEGRREAFCALLLECLSLGARLVSTCRHQESARLPRAIRGKQPIRLEPYNSDELERAIQSHTASYYRQAGLASAHPDAQRIQQAAARGKPLKEVCENPLTLRMLFELYAPERIHELEINTCRLYQEFWEKRVRSDHRAGSALPGSSADLGRGASALGLVLLGEGRTELPVELARERMRDFGGDPSDLPGLLSRGVLRQTRQGHLGFFHQTFLEHAAARGLLAWRDARGLRWARGKLRAAPGDAFLAPVFQEALVLGEGAGQPIDSTVDTMTEELLVDPDQGLYSLGLYAYAHRIRPTEQQRRRARDLLASGAEERGKTALPAQLWLDTAPNTERHRLGSLLEEADLLWSTSGWATQQRLLSLLARLAGRAPEDVLRLLGSWRVPEWLQLVPETYAAEQEAAAVGIALLEDRTAWSWGFLREIYGLLLELRGRYRPIHARIARALAGGPDLGEGSGPADRFEREFRHGKLVKTPTGLAESHGKLWDRQWRDEGRDLASVLQEIREGFASFQDLPRVARLAALRARLEDEPPERVAEVFEEIVEAGDRHLLSRFLYVVVDPMLTEPGPHGQACRQAWRRQLQQAQEDNSSQRRRLLVNCLRKSEPTPEQLAALLAGLRIEPEHWFLGDHFRPVFGRALAAEIPSVENALQQALDSPEALREKGLGGVASNLANSEDETFLPAAFRLAMALGDVEVLLRVFRRLEHEPPWLADPGVRSKLESLLLREARQKQHLAIRSKAIKAWRHLVRLGSLEPPDLDLVEQAVAAGSDTRSTIAWLQLLVERPPSAAVAPIFRFLAELTRSTKDPDLADHGRSAMVRIVSEAEDPSPWLDEALDAALLPEPTSDRVGHLTKAFSRLCDLSDRASGQRGSAADPAPVERVLQAVDRIFETCMDRNVGRAVAQEVGNKLKGVLIKAFRVAGAERVEFLVERCRRDVTELAMAPIAAVYALHAPRLRRLLDALYEDSNVPEQTRALIGRHKHYTERPSGGRGYPDLYELEKVEPDAPTKPLTNKPAVAEEPMAPAVTEPAPVDLLWRIESKAARGSLVFEHSLTYPSERVDHAELESTSEILNREDLGAAERHLYDVLESAMVRQNEKGESIFGRAVVDAVHAVGSEIADRLIPENVRDFFRRRFSSIDSILIEANDARIPWELAQLGPAGKEDHLCLQAAVGRWMIYPKRAAPPPPGLLAPDSLLGLIAGQVEGYDVLASAPAEAEMLQGLLAQHRLAGKVVEDAQTSDLLERLQKSPPGLLHFQGHGDLDPRRPDRASLIFEDESLTALALSSARLRSIAELHPFVFLNACRVGRAGQALTGIGGWPDRWVRLGRCGALICPQWAVVDETAHRFAEGFYRRLEDPAMTLGRAMRETRVELLDLDPEDPTPLAYALYGHPHARVRFGGGKDQTTTNRTSARAGRVVEVPKPEREPTESQQASDGELKTNRRQGRKEQSVVRNRVFRILDAELGKDLDRDPRFRAAIAAYLLGNIKEARETLHSLAKEYNLSRLILNLGYLHYLDGGYEDALRAYDAYIEREPLALEGYLNAAKTALSIKNVTLAKKYGSAAKKLAPKKIEVRKLEAMIALEEGDWVEMGRAMRGVPDEAIFEHAEDNDLERLRYSPSILAGEGRIEVLVAVFQKRGIRTVLLAYRGEDTELERPDMSKRWRPFVRNCVISYEDLDIDDNNVAMLGCRFTVKDSIDSNENDDRESSEGGGDGDSVVGILFLEFRFRGLRDASDDSYSGIFFADQERRMVRPPERFFVPRIRGEAEGDLIDLYQEILGAPRKFASGSRRYPRVFVAYASEDSEIADLLCKGLKEHGVDVWRDKTSLRVGAAYMLEIEQAIEESDFAIILLTKNSVPKFGPIQREIRKILEMQQLRPEGVPFALPLRADDCEVPRQLRFLQWMDLGSDRPGYIKKLVEDISAHFEIIRRTKDR